MCYHMYDNIRKDWRALHMAYAICKWYGSPQKKKGW